MPSLREIETASIRRFLESHADKLTGRVLDYGCGQQPYRDIVETAGGHYVGYDRPEFGGSVVPHPVGQRSLSGSIYGFDAIVCTQVIQYVTEPPHEFVEYLYGRLVRGGWLLMTGPTNWPIVEADDLWRFTPSGAARLLADAGFAVDVSERHAVECGGERWLCGWAIAAQA